MKTKFVIPSILAFVEGASVMVLEIAVAKLIEPWFGSSLYVWACVLGITLCGLAIGYFLGGRLAQKYSAKKVLQFCFLISSLLLIATPMLSKAILPIAISINGISGICFAAISLLLPIMILFGCIAPAIISDNDGKATLNSGALAGTIYAVSTLGGVINVILAGIILLPNLGITNTLYIYGIILLIVSLIFLGISFLRNGSAIVLCLVFVLVNSNIESKPSLSRELNSAKKIFGNVPIIKHKVLYSSDGLLGRLRVVDLSVQINSNTVGNMRGMLVNNTWQTLNNRDNDISVFDYVGVMKGIMEGYPALKNILHIGLGGGQLSKILSQQNRNITTVELDTRMPKLAKKYFNLPLNTKVIKDDGRHFINTSNQKYDAIIINAFNASMPAWSLYTKECFTKCHKLTIDDGIMILEIGGFIKSDSDIIVSSMVKTIEAANWKCAVLKTKTTEGADYICVAYKNNKPDFNNMFYRVLSHQQNIQEMLVSQNSLNTKFEILTDDKPILSKWVSDKLFD